jgi:3-dehydroquinate synthase
MNYTLTDHIADLIQRLKALLQEKKFVVLVDSNTHELCLPIIMAHGFPIEAKQIVEIQPGEASKNHTNLVYVYKRMTENQLNRTDLVLNIGGGVVSDIGGFAASTYMRGIQYINIPTTLLAMVDAAHGGKTGINFENHKNYIGTFSEPLTTIIYTPFLESLPSFEYQSGFAEHIKHMLLVGGQGWNELVASSNGTESALHKISINSLKASINFKLRTVLSDPHETGLRRILNFGHTIGHALEKHYQDKSLMISHGHAVAIGMICALKLSKDKLQLPDHSFIRAVNFINRLYQKIHLAPSDIDAIVFECGFDKKNNANQINFVLLEDIGNPKTNVPVLPQDIQEACEYYNQS